MNDPSLEADVRKNRENIAELTVGLTKLGGMVENTMEKLDRVVDTLDKQNENTSTMAAMQRDIASINEKIAAQYADIAANRHDYKNALHTLQALPLMQDKITTNSNIGVKHETRLDAQQDQISELKSWRDKCDGAGVTKYKDDIESVRTDISKIKVVAQTSWKALAAFGSIVVALSGAFSWFVARAGH